MGFERCFFLKRRSGFFRCVQKKGVECEGAVQPKIDNFVFQRHKSDPIFGENQVAFVIHPGLEPGTYCLEGSCSIQLS